MADPVGVVAVVGHVQLSRDVHVAAVPDGPDVDIRVGRIYQIRCCDL